MCMLRCFCFWWWGEGSVLARFTEESIPARPGRHLSRGLIAWSAFRLEFSWMLRVGRLPPPPTAHPATAPWGCPLPVPTTLTPLLPDTTTWSGCFPHLRLLLSSLSLSLWESLERSDPRGVDLNTSLCPHSSQPRAPCFLCVWTSCPGPCAQWSLRREEGTISGFTPPLG